jgi:hypothetical protein
MKQFLIIFIYEYSFKKLKHWDLVCSFLKILERYIGRIQYESRNIFWPEPHETFTQLLMCW